MLKLLLAIDLSLVFYLLWSAFILGGVLIRGHECPSPGNWECFELRTDTVHPPQLDCSALPTEADKAIICYQWSPVESGETWFGVVALAVALFKLVMGGFGTLLIDIMRESQSAACLERTFKLVGAALFVMEFFLIQFALVNTMLAVITLMAFAANLWLMARLHAHVRQEHAHQAASLPLLRNRPAPG